MDKRVMKVRELTFQKLSKRTYDATLKCLTSRFTWRSETRQQASSDFVVSER
jgi:hypothetical protein